MHARYVTALLLAGHVPAALGSQVTSRSAGRELGDMFADAAAMWTSPARAGSRDWFTAAALSVGFGALVPLDDQVDRWVVAHPRAAIVRMLAPFREAHREVARIPTARRLLPASAALVVAGLLSDNRELREAGYGCMSGWAAASTIRYAVYRGVSRRRPSAAEGDQYLFSVPGGGWNEQSLLAGHAMNAVACVTFWNERFDLGVAEPLLYAGAAGLSLARIADRRHWASDTFVGVAIGYAIGRAVASRQAHRDAARERRAASASGTAARSPRPERVTVILWQRRFR